MSTYEPLHHKYRPQTLADLVGQEAIATTLTNALKTERIAPAYLLTGARGTGKTSTARIMAKSLNCIRFDAPTPTPCGECSMCREITTGRSLDITEIDAASNTGVDNIREIIERAQFAPVQARYKVYAIDECLTGDSLVQTSDGLLRIDDPTLKGKKVLSYNDSQEVWEYKKVLRWLDRGTRQTFTIRTTNRELRCTANHLIRTDRGWIAAENVKEGMKILSPVNVAAAHSSTNMGRTDANVGLGVDINFVEMISGERTTISPQLSKTLNLLNLTAPVDVEKPYKFQIFYNNQVEVSDQFSLTGQSIHIKRDTAYGAIELINILPRQEQYRSKHWDLSTEHCLEMAPLLIQTNIVDSLDWHGRMGQTNLNGCPIKLVGLVNYVQNSDSQLIKDSENYQLAVTQLAIHNSKKFLLWLNQTAKIKVSLWSGFIKSLQKVWLGGIWMMAHLSKAEIAKQFTYVRKDSQKWRIKLLPSGLQNLDILQRQNLTKELIDPCPITTSRWGKKLVGNGSQISSSFQSHQWNTSLEEVQSVVIHQTENVYDIEVEDNHNFVANGLLVHNCHMLSTAAFNALLKTLEEPPDRVVFILATTDPQRVLPTIISRCQRFDFRRIPLNDIVSHLGKIAQNEKITISPEALLLVSQISQGGLRDAESLLDQLSLIEEGITPEAVWDLVGSVPERDLLSLLEAIASDSATEIIDVVRKIMDRGREPLIVLQSLAGSYRDLLIAKTASDRHDLVALTPQSWERLRQIAQALSLSAILEGQKYLRSTEVQIKNSTQPRLWLEVTLMSLLPSAISPSALPQSSVNSPVNSLANPQVNFKPHNQPQASPQTPSQIPPATPPIPVQESKPPVPAIPQPAIATNPAINPERESIENPAPIPEPITREVPPPQEPPAIAPEPPANPFSVDLETSWQQILAHLEPISRVAKSVLAQQGKLLEVNQAIVKIGITRNNIRHVKPKMNEVEQCCRKVFGNSVKLEIESMESLSAADIARNSTAPSPAFHPTPTKPPTVQESSQPKPQEPIRHAPAFPVSDQKQGTSHIQTPPISYHTSSPAQIGDSTSSQTSSIHQVAIAPVGILPSVNSQTATLDHPSPTRNMYISPSEEEVAIRRIADIFNGQVISLEEEDSDPVE
jgi:DNA polymerase III subunit gamma/tau